MNSRIQRKPSVILMGSKPGSIVCLEELINRNWDIKYVVIAKSINHSWVAGPTLEEIAKSNGIPVVIQKELPTDIQVDFVISYMYRFQVKSEVIALAKRGALNFHAGPLPRFGGWAFYNVAILENVNKYGCTCHYMDNGFDTGPILKVRWFSIDAKKETAISLEKKAQLEMVMLFKEFASLAESEECLPKLIQKKEEMRYMSKEEFETLKEIPENADESTIDRYARAFWYPPYQCAYIIKNGTKVEVVPAIAKNEIAGLYHTCDLKELRMIVHHN